VSARKSRREIDKAISHLMNYTGPNEEWAGRLQMLENDLLLPVADKLDLDVEELSEFLTEGPFGHMVFGFLFEEYAAVPWDNEEHSLIGAYLKHRGWREGLAGRRYLQALNQSELGFWEVTAVKPGSHADLRPFGTQKKPIRVREKAATEALHQWDGLAARVLHLDGSYSFSGALLPFSPETAGRVLSTLELVSEQMQTLMQELVDKGELEALPDNIDESIRDAQDADLPEIVFQLWVMDAYLTLTAPSPEMRNMDGESIELIQLRFPLCSERTKVAAALKSAPFLDMEGGSTDRWIWLPKSTDSIQEGEHVNINGHVTLTDTSLHLEVNSRRRAELGGALLSALLGKLVGTPLTVHQNLEQMEQLNEAAVSPSDLPPDIEAAMEAHLTNHYRQTLDEPVQMLNGKTPRECAADPNLNNDVTRWLKHLENSSMQAGHPAYDFTWMWDELKLIRE